MLTVENIESTLAIKDSDQKVQAIAKLMRLVSEDLLENFDHLEVEPQEDDSLLITLPSSIKVLLDTMEDDDMSYECTIYHNGQFIPGGFTLLNEADADRLDSLFLE